MGTLWQDLRYGLRTLRLNPGFAVVAVLTLALGVGVNTSMFSVVNGVLLTDLPYRQPDRLVLIRVSIEGSDSLPSVSPPEVVDFRERTDIFESVAAIRDNSATLTGTGEPEQIQIGGMTWNFLSQLGLEPLHGRSFTAQDAVRGPPASVMISYGLWQRRFGGNPDIVGRRIQLNGNGTTVIGVLPQGAQLLLPREAGLPKDLDAWWPFGFDFRSAPRFRWMRGIGRLKPGVTYERAQAAMDTLAEELIGEFPAYQQQRFAYLVAPLHDDLVRTVRTPLLVLFGAVAFVLLIACANVANLLLARAANREQEINLRAALGASRVRLIRQMMTESLLIAALGGAAGFLLARWGVALLLRLAPPTLPRLDTVALDYRVFAFALGASLLTVLLFGLVPALHATRTNLAESLKSGLRAAGGTERARLRKLLVTAEIALSLVLLVGAGLMIRSFLLLQQVRPGFNPESMLTFQIALPFTKYGTPQEVSQFFRQLTENVEALPGVEAVGGSFPLPMSGRFWTNDYAYDEETEQNWGGLESDNHVVLPGYFRSLGARVLAGRTFTWADEAENAKVIVIDDKLARKAWPGENPIGKRLTVLFPNNAHEPLEVIGVVAHIRQSHPGTDGREQTYLLPAHWPLWGLPLTVRASLPPGEALRGVKREVRALDPELAVFQVRTMRGYVSEVTAGNRFAMFLMGLFAVLAAALAAIGLYGTIAYSVAQRSHEIGIRMALGASPRQVFRLVVGQGVRLTAVGIVLGVAASFLLTRFLSSLLYGVNPMDWPTYAGITVLLVLIALLACYLPARRATRVQPMVALRYE